MIEKWTKNANCERPYYVLKRRVLQTVLLQILILTLWVLHPEQQAVIVFHLYHPS